MNGKMNTTKSIFVFLSQNVVKNKITNSHIEILKCPPPKKNKNSPIILSEDVCKNAPWCDWKSQACTFRNGVQTVPRAG
jgi:hypothetical protein